MIIPPILNIYRKYYGGKMAVFLASTFYLSMVGAALLVEGVFALLHLIPQGMRHGIADQGIRLNYTTVLSALFAVLAIALVIAFFRTGGPKMMKEMEGGEHGGHHHHH